jgi:glutamyl-tRNA synthetase
MTNEVSNNKPRVRFAPSPTGPLHIGNVRVAIFNYLFAKHHGGTYTVRVEDTDIERSKQEYTDSILDSLQWLNLMPDEEVVYQRSRVSEHKKLLDELLKKGLVYPCFCEPKTAEEKMSALEKGAGEKYDGTCRDKKWTIQDLKKPHALRFKIPSDCTNVKFDDLIRGEISIDTDQLDDFIVMRRAGNPIYNFVVVADDIAMNITHVIRGEDHISNTPKQILLYKALEKEIPKFAHLPLILGPAGNKLSKRDAAVAVTEYKKIGILADAFLNYLVRLGWSHGDQEVFSREELIKYFDLDHVGKKGAIFDIKKLEWLNGTYIRNLDLETYLIQLEKIDENKHSSLTELWDRATLVLLFELYRERAVTLVEIAVNVISLGAAPDSLDMSLIKKWVKPQTSDVLKEFLEYVEGNEISEEKLSHDALIKKAKELCEKFELKLVSIAQPLRLAITGSTCSPGIFDLIPLFTKEEINKRVTSLIKQL